MERTHHPNYIGGQEENLHVVTLVVSHIGGVTLPLNEPLVVILLISSMIAMAGAAAGVWVSGVPEVTRRIVPFGGAALLVISMVWVLPELTQTFGWPQGPAMMFAGFTVVWVLDRYVYPICPACS